MNTHILSGQSLIHHTDADFNKFRDKVSKPAIDISQYEGKTYRVTNTDFNDDKLNIPRKRISNMDDLHSFVSGRNTGYLKGMNNTQQNKLVTDVENIGRGTIYRLHEPNRPKDYGWN